MKEQEEKDVSFKYKTDYGDHRVRHPCSCKKMCEL